ncbi:MAG: FecR family protein [Sulfuricella sp.]
MKNTTVFRLVPLCAVLLAAFPTAAEAGIAGRFQFVAGDVRVIDASGQERPAKKGDNLNEGESVLSALNASAQVKMIDGGFMAIRPDSRVKVDAYQYDGKEDGTEKGLLSIVKGGFRAITGAIGRTHKENYKIATPAATIGIRGTDHEPVVVLPPPPGAETPVPPGTYDKVNVGAAYLENPQGIADVGPNKVGYAAGPDVKPVVLPTIPPIYSTTPTVGGKNAKKEEKQDKKEQKTAEQKTASTTTATNDTAAEPIRTATATDTLLLSQPAATVATATSALPTSVTSPTEAATDATIATNAIVNQVTQTVTPTPTPTPTPVQTQPAYTPGAFVATGLSGYYFDTASLANLNSQLSQLGTTLTNAQTGLTQGDNAIAAVNATLVSVGSSLATAQTSYDSVVAGLGTINAATYARVLFEVANTLSYATQAKNEGVNTVTAVQPALDSAHNAYTVGNQGLQNATDFMAAPGSVKRDEAVKYYSLSQAAISTASSNASSAISNASSYSSAANSAATSAHTAANTAAANLANEYLPAPTVPGVNPVYDALAGAVALAQAVANAADAAAQATAGAGGVAQQLQTAMGGISVPYYGYGMPLNSPYFSDSGAGLTVTRNAAGQVTGYSSGDTGSDGSSWSQSVSYAGGTAADFGQDTATGMSWGRWVGGKVNQSYQNKYWDSTTNSWITSSGQPWYELGSGSAHWITGKEADPGYLGMALTGSATYTKIGGTNPTDNYGNVGTLNSASLNVNFTTQTANVGVNFTVNNNIWAMDASPVLRGGKEFHAYGCYECTSSSTMTSFTKNGQSVLNSRGNSWGSMDGELLGAGLNSSALRYHVGENINNISVTDLATGTAATTSTENAYDGVVAFSGPTQNAQTPYRAVMVMKPDYGTSSSSIPMTGYYGPYDYYSGMWGAENTVGPAASVVTDGAGALQSLTVQGTNYLAPGATVSTWTDQVVKITPGTAVAKDVGMDAATGISWGRWEGGALNVSSLSGAALGTLSNTGTNGVNGNAHWIASGTLTAPPTLPLTGTYAYNLAGNTHPTDSQGNVGTLQSLTLNANFTAMTVDAAAKVAINVNSAPQNWTLNASGMPITGGEFTGISGGTSAPVTVSCTGCTGTAGGGIGGQFIGNGAPAVGVGYRMVENPGATSIGNTITGVAVMKR